MLLWATISSRMPVVAASRTSMPELRQPPRAAGVQQPLWMIVACAVITVVLGYFAATKLVERELREDDPAEPALHPNYLANPPAMRGLGNAVRVVVEKRDGDIFDRSISKCSSRSTTNCSSLPVWTGDGRNRCGRRRALDRDHRGGLPRRAGDAGLVRRVDRSVEQLKQNIARSGIVGSLVADNFKSSMIFVPLLDRDPAPGSASTTTACPGCSRRRSAPKYELAKEDDKTAGAKAAPRIRIHVIGFAKLIGELIDGLIKVMMFFAIAALIATVIIFFYTRCVRSTAVVIACSIVAVVWQLGLVAVLGFELDPFSILVPFLVFAMGVSHGAQRMNGIMQDIGRGTHKLVAARYTFRRLFIAGLTALLADVVGFAVLMVIDIPVIKELALTASIGVAVLIFTNLLLLPVLLSYTGVSARAAARSLREESEATRGKGIGKCGCGSISSRPGAGRSARSARRRFWWSGALR